MKRDFILFRISISLIAATNGFSQKDTCVVLTGSPLNQDACSPVRKILENQLDLFPGHQSFGNGRGMSSCGMNLGHPVLERNMPVSGQISQMRKKYDLPE